MLETNVAIPSPSTFWGDITGKNTLSFDYDSIKNQYALDGGFTEFPVLAPYNVNDVAPTER